MMRVATDDELAAIACAYALLVRRGTRAPRASSRWALAGRLDADIADARICAASARWPLAARLPS